MGLSFAIGVRVVALRRRGRGCDRRAACVELGGRSAEGCRATRARGVLATAWCNMSAVIRRSERRESMFRSSRGSSCCRRRDWDIVGRENGCAGAL